MEEKIKQIMRKKGRKAHKLREIASKLTGEDFTNSKLRYSRIHRIPMILRVAQLSKKINKKYLVVNLYENGEYVIYETEFEDYMPVGVF